MNEVLRLLDRVLKKRGYSIKKHPEYNLLPLKSFEGFAEQKKVYDSFSYKSESEPDNTNKLEIY